MTVAGFDDTPSYDICTTWDGNVDSAYKNGNGVWEVYTWL